MSGVSREIRIRPYEKADWPRLCEIHDAARLDELRLSVGEDAFLSLEDTYENEGLFDDKLSVAEMEGVVRGFVAFGEDELTWLYVEPSFYRRGLGRALVQHAAANAAGEMQIDLLEGNAPALKLYESEGFTVDKRVEGQLIGNEDFAASGLTLKRKVGDTSGG